MTRTGKVFFLVFSVFVLSYETGATSKRIIPEPREAAVAEPLMTTVSGQTLTSLFEGLNVTEAGRAALFHMSVGTNSDCVDRGCVREANPGDFGIMTLLGALTPDQGPSLQVVNDCQGHYRVFSTYSCYVSGQNCQYRFSYNDPNTAIHDDGYCKQERGEPCDGDCPWGDWCDNSL